MSDSVIDNVAAHGDLGALTRGSSVVPGPLSSRGCCSGVLTADAFGTDPEEALFTESGRGGIEFHEAAGWTLDMAVLLEPLSWLEPIGWNGFVELEVVDAGLDGVFEAFVAWGGGGNALGSLTRIGELRTNDGSPGGSA